MKDLNKIAKDSWKSYQYAKSLHFKNVPLIIIKSIAKIDYSSYDYACNLSFKNVPLIIWKSLIKHHYNMSVVLENKHFLIYMLQYDKRMKIII